MRAMRFARTPRGGIGLAILGLVVAIALVGPFLAPHDPAKIVGAPGAGPSSAAPLGTDYLGHDVLSRVLWGGRSVLWLSLSATALAYVLGLTAGLVAGYVRGLADTLLMRSVDVVLAFPPLLFFLVVATSVGTSELVLVVGVALVLAPGIARVVYSATREASVRGYVESAVARGERTAAILRREVLPDVAAPVIANAGLTLTFSVLLIAGINFLGLGLQPPSANWALMISENRPILPLNAWATVAPAVLIAALTIAINLVGDAISHALGMGDAEEPMAAAADAKGLPT